MDMGLKGTSDYIIIKNLHWSRNTSTSIPNLERSQDLCEKELFKEKNKSTGGGFSGDVLVVRLK